MTLRARSESPEAIFTSAAMDHRVIRRITGLTGVTSIQAQAMAWAANDPALPPDLSTVDEELFPMIGRRACRRLASGFEPKHWNTPEFQCFRKLLGLIIVTRLAPVDKLWAAARQALQAAANQQSSVVFENKLVAAGLDHGSHRWALADIWDDAQVAREILTQAELAIWTWPTHVVTAAPARLAAIRTAAAPTILNETQCEAVYLLARGSAGSSAR